MAHQQPTLEGTTSDDVIRTGQKKRGSKVINRIRSRFVSQRQQQGSEHSYSSLNSNKNLCKCMPVFGQMCS